MTSVRDSFDRKDVAQMIVSFFAILGVLSTKTILPTDGILLTIIVIVLLFISLFLYLMKKKIKIAVIETSKHLLAGIVISGIMTIIAAVAYGYDVMDMNVLTNSEVTVAFNFGLVWAALLDSLKE